MSINIISYCVVTILCMFLALIRVWEQFYIICTHSHRWTRSCTLRVIESVICKSRVYTKIPTGTRYCHTCTHIICSLLMVGVIVFQPCVLCLKCTQMDTEDKRLPPDRTHARTHTHRNALSVPHWGIVRMWFSMSLLFVWEWGIQWWHCLRFKTWIWPIYIKDDNDFSHLCGIRGVCLVLLLIIIINWIFLNISLNN